MYDVIKSVFDSIKPLPEKDWELIKERFKPVFFKKKERLLDVEQVANHYYFINTGLIRLYGYKEGEEKTLFIFKEGNIAGSITSYFHGKPSTLVLEALEDTEALRVSREDLEYIFQHSTTLTHIILIITQVRLQALLEFFSSFVLDSPEERYEKFVEKEPDLVNRVPQHIIASFLGVTPVSLSRIRKRIFDKR